MSSLQTVVLVVREYPPDVGGIATLTSDYVRFLSRVADVRVLALPQAPASRPEVTVLPDDIDRREGIDALLQLVPPRTPVLFNHCNCYSLALLDALRARKSPLFTLVHGADINSRGRYLGVRTWLRRFRGFRRQSAIIANSRSTRALFERRFPGVRTEIVHPGVTRPSPPGNAKRTRDILSIGRLIERKGFDTLIRAVAVIKHRELDPSLTFVGEGPFRPALEALASQLEVNVRFAGRVSDLAVELASHKVFCQLPRVLSSGDIEGFGIVFLEAAAAGLPVVAGNSGGVPDAVHDGVNGYLVDPNDPNAAADRLAALLTDDTLRERMGAASIEWARRFSWAERDPAAELRFLLPNKPVITS